MTTIAVIGLGSFGCRIVEELIETQAELIILDRDREIVEKYKNSVVNAYITDAISEETAPASAVRSCPCTRILMLNS